MKSVISLRCLLTRGRFSEANGEFNRRLAAVAIQFDLFEACLLVVLLQEFPV
jgi:hypothetical protein